MAIIQFKRRTAGGPIAPPASANAGEPFYSAPGFTGGGPNALYIDNGTALVPLVDSTRQVELAGAQTITGVKTVSGAGAIALASVTNLTVADGATGQVMLKGAGTALGWGTPPPATVTVDGVTITGDGSALLPIALIPAIFKTGLAWTAPDTVDVIQATQAALGGGMIANLAGIALGTDDATILTPLGLRGELGAAAATLITAAKTVVPAINEIHNAITALVGVVIFAGSYDGTLSQGTFNGQGGIPAGTSALPAASAANHGAYVIASVAGAGGGVNEPAGAIGVGDWLISDGTAWIKLAFSQAPMTAAGIGVVPPVAGGNNVQDALEGLFTLASAPGFYDATTFTGDALTAGTQLVLAFVDGGTF